MDKIIRITDKYVLVANEAKELTKVPIAAFDFEPTINKKIEVYQLHNEYFVNEADEIKIPKPIQISNHDDLEKLKERININIINENKPQNNNSNYSSNNQNMSYIQEQPRRGGVNKWLFIFVSLFLGGLGGNFFMLGKTFVGVISLLFFWTGVPVILGMIHAAVAIFKRPDFQGNIYF